MAVNLVHYPQPIEWTFFERLCRQLWAEEWGFLPTQLNGRQGQRQDGVDIWGKASGVWVGIQCKGRSRWPPRKLKPEDLKSAVQEAVSFKPALKHLIIATVADDDARISESARMLTEPDSEFAEQWESVSVFGWGSILELLSKHPSVARVFYPAQFGVSTTVFPIDLRGDSLEDVIKRDAKAVRLKDLLNALPVEAVQSEVEKVIAELERQFNESKTDYETNGYSLSIESLKAVLRKGEFYLSLEWSPESPTGNQSGFLKAKIPTDYGNRDVSYVPLMKFDADQNPTFFWRREPDTYHPYPPFDVVQEAVSNFRNYLKGLED